VQQIARESEDWAEILDRVLEGDAVACLQIGRLVTGFLAGWRAYDFRDDWADVVQEALLAVLRVARAGKIQNRGATFAYIRTVARNKFIDHLRRQLGRPEDQDLPWGDTTRIESIEAERRAGPEDLADLRLALEKLPEKRRRIVLSVYGEGKTYQQVAEETGTPLGTLKRYLREDLARLRACLAGKDSK
jgi:RNA polymerase sigma-70 factor (ECF subfamily)